jgi:hypothetical protein
LDVVASRISTWMRDRGASATDQQRAFALVENASTGLHFSYVGAVGADEYLFRLAAAVLKKPDDEVLR